MNRPKLERLEGNALREQLRAEQGNHCAWCKVEMEDAAWGYPRPPRSVTLDHVEPRCVGGELSAENCVAACNACNLRRADELNAARARIMSLVDRSIKTLTPAEIETRLGRVAQELRA